MDHSSRFELVVSQVRFRAGMSPLPGGVIPCGMRVPVAVWQPCELRYTCYLLTYGIPRLRSIQSVAWWRNGSQRFPVQLSETRET